VDGHRYWYWHRCQHHDETNVSVGNASAASGMLSIGSSGQTKFNPAGSLSLAQVIAGSAVTLGADGLGFNKDGGNTFGSAYGYAGLLSFAPSVGLFHLEFQLRLGRRYQLFWRWQHSIHYLPNRSVYLNRVFLVQLQPVEHRIGAPFPLASMLLEMSSPRTSAPLQVRLA